MKKNSLYLLLVTIFLTACEVSKQRNREVATTANSWYLNKYRYADGNANEYVFSKNSFEYLPVKPAQSSSGIYDGGSYIKKLPDMSKFYSLVDLIKIAYETKTDHIENRVKGSGSIQIGEAGNKIAFMLKPSSGSLQKIEEVLKQIKEIK